MTISVESVEFFLLDHSTLDGLLADLDRWRDSCRGYSDNGTDRLKKGCL